MSASDYQYPRQYLYQRVVRAKLFMDANYAGRIDLDNIADCAHFSKYHFIKLFKSIYRKTPNQYLTGVRIEKAMLLLQQQVMVSDVCIEVGFDSVSTFSTLFKKYTDFTPATYRERHCMRIEHIRTVPLQFVPACFANQYSWAQKSQF